MAPWKIGALAALSMLTTTATSHAGQLYFQGFESDTSGWQVPTGGDTNGSITQTTSGGGTLGLTAFDGSQYGEVQNDTNDYQPGYGTGGFSFLGGTGSPPPLPYPGSSFSQSITVYINTATAAPSNAATPAFWIDMSPSSVSTDGVGCFPAACSDEHNFRLTYSGSSVSVTTDGSTTPALVITNSGWYTFQNTYAKGANPSDLVATDMNIFDPSHALVSTTHVLGNSDGATLPSSNLAGPGYIWLTVWQNGFSKDILGIDDVRTDAVPEPPALWLFATAVIAATGLGRRRKRNAAI